MFRDLYKEANDNIKGDRAILDKAFLKAAQPEKKKSPVLRYSFVGTAAAAVLVLGAVFLNSDVFMEKTQNMPTPDEINQLTMAPTEKINENNSIKQTDNAENVRITADEAQNGADARVADVISEHIAEEPNGYNNENVMVMSADANDDLEVSAYTEAENTNATVGFSMKKTEEADDDAVAWGEEEIAEDGLAVPEEDAETFKMTKPTASSGGGSASGGSGSVADKSDTLTAKVFSYMYDTNLYDGGEQGEYKNTDVCPVESVEEAIERAKNECTVEYDTVDAYFDPAERIWKIAFCFASTDDMVITGGGQNVYMTEDGITVLIIYAE